MEESGGQFARSDVLNLLQLRNKLSHPLMSASGCRTHLNVHVPTTKMGYYELDSMRNTPSSSEGLLLQCQVHSRVRLALRFVQVKIAQQHAGIKTVCVSAILQLQGKKMLN